MTDTKRRPATEAACLRLLARLSEAGVPDDDLMARAQADTLRDMRTFEARGEVTLAGVASWRLDWFRARAQQVPESVPTRQFAKPVTEDEWVHSEGLAALGRTVFDRS